MSDANRKEVLAELEEMAQNPERKSNLDKAIEMVASQYGIENESIESFRDIPLLDIAYAASVFSIEGITEKSIRHMTWRIKSNFLSWRNLEDIREFGAPTEETDKAFRAHIAAGIPQD